MFPPKSVGTIDVRKKSYSNCLNSHLLFSRYIGTMHAINYFIHLVTSHPKKLTIVTLKYGHHLNDTLNLLKLCLASDRKFLFNSTALQPPIWQCP
jgi:hypothetical protein